MSLSFDYVNLESGAFGAFGGSGLDHEGLTCAGCEGLVRVLGSNAIGKVAMKLVQVPHLETDRSCIDRDVFPDLEIKCLVSSSMGSTPSNHSRASSTSTLNIQQIMIPEILEIKEHSVLIFPESPLHFPLRDFPQILSA